MPRLDRALRYLTSQDTARTNAAAASARLRTRRHEQEEVDAYLTALDRTNLTAETTGRDLRSPAEAPVHFSDPVDP